MKKQEAEKLIKVFEDKVNAYLESQQKEGLQLSAEPYYVSFNRWQKNGADRLYINVSFSLKAWHKDKNGKIDFMKQQDMPGVFGYINLKTNRYSDKVFRPFACNLKDPDSAIKVMEIPERVAEMQQAFTESKIPEHDRDVLKIYKNATETVKRDWARGAVGIHYIKEHVEMWQTDIDKMTDVMDVTEDTLEKVVAMVKEIKDKVNEHCTMHRTLVDFQQKIDNAKTLDELPTETEFAKVLGQLATFAAHQGMEKNEIGELQISSTFSYKINDYNECVRNYLNAVARFNYKEKEE